MRFSQNPTLHYLRISDDEVVVKGSHLEGFSLLISDDRSRGFTGDLIGSLHEPASAEEAHQNLSVADLDVHELREMLDDLADAGALLRHGPRRAGVADWISFLRYGHVDPAVQRHPLVCVGADAAALVTDSLTALGLAADHRPTMDATDLEAFVVPDASVDVADAADDGPWGEGRRSSDDDLPDDDRPRLVILVEGSALATLHKLNEAAMEAGVPVLYAQVAGSDYAVGPYVVPGATACFWEYERQRSRSLFSYSEYAVLSRLGGATRTPPVSRAALVAAAVPHLVEVALLGRSMLAGRVLRGRATTGETSTQSVMRLPRCPVCLATRPLLRNLLY